MFGFSAFAEQPLGDADAAVAGVASVPVGAIGSSALGAHAIGRGATEGSGGADVTATVASNTLTITAPTATASGAVQGNASAASNTITLTAPVVSVNTGAVVTVDAGKASQTFAVTVVNDGGGNKYYIDGVKQASLSLHEEGTYRFDVSASSVGGHPFNFSTTSDGTHNSGSAYTTGVTTVGTAGQAGAYLEIVVTTSTPDLYYYCSYHSGMGGAVAFSEQFSQVPFFVILSPQTSSATGDAAATADLGALISTVTPAPAVSADYTITVQLVALGLTPAQASGTGDAVATFADSIEVGLTAPTASVSASAAAAAQGASITASPPIAFPDFSQTRTLLSGSTVTETTTRYNGASTITAPLIGNANSGNGSVAVDPDVYGEQFWFTSNEFFENTKSVDETAVLSSTALGWYFIDWPTQSVVQLIRGKSTGVGQSAPILEYIIMYQFDDSGNIRPKASSQNYAANLPTQNNIGANFRDVLSPTNSFIIEGGASLSAASAPVNPYFNFDINIGVPYLYFADPNQVGSRKAVIQVYSFDRETVNGNYQLSWNLGSGFYTVDQSTTTSSSRFQLGDIFSRNTSNPNSPYADLYAEPVPNWPGAALPWRGNWASRSTQNYMLYSLVGTNTSVSSDIRRFIYLAAENGDNILVSSEPFTSTGRTAHLAEAEKFVDGTYANSVYNGHFTNGDATLEANADDRLLKTKDVLQNVTIDATASVNTLGNALSLAVTSADVTGSGNYEVNAALVTVTVSPLSGSVQADGNATSALPAALPLTAAAPVAEAGGTATSALPAALPTTTPLASATGGALINVGLPTLDTSPAAAATSATVSGSVVVNVFVQLDVTAPSASPSGAALTTITDTPSIDITPLAQSVSAGCALNIALPNVTVSSSAPSTLAEAIFSVALPTLTLTTLTASAGFSGDASASAATLTLSTPSPTVSASVNRAVVSNTLSVSASEPTTAVVEFPEAFNTVSITAAESSLSLGATVESALVTLDTAPPLASASAGVSVTAEIALVTLDTSPPLASASAGVSVTAESALVTLDTAPPLASAIGTISATASTALPTLSTTAPEVSSTIVDFPEVFNSLVVSAPAATVSASADVEIALVTLDTAPPAATATATASVIAEVTLPALPIVSCTPTLIYSTTAGGPLTVQPPVAVFTDGAAAQAFENKLTFAAPEPTHAAGAVVSNSLTTLTTTAPEAAAFEFRPLELDPDRIIVVPQETRTQVIEEANRLLVITQETRTVEVA